MDTQHANTDCCRTQAYRYGGRRRRCRSCGRTWRIRVKKRGRKRLRPWHPGLCRSVLHRQSFAQQAARGRLPPGAVRHRFRTTLAHYLGQPRPALGPGPWVLIADGLWFRFLGREWVLYLMAVRPAPGSLATFLDPLLLPGKESAERWARALTTIPTPVRQGIVAFVTDGFRGAKTLAASHGWIFQRCHFHLLAQLHAHRGRRRTTPGRDLRAAIVHQVRALLDVHEGPRVAALTAALVRQVVAPTCPRKLRMIVRDFLRERPAFHAYRRHQDLALPTTTNTAESMANLLRQVVRRLRTPAALLKWATALIRLRPTVTCNGHHATK